jgi:hypothetical protein
MREGTKQQHGEIINPLELLREFFVAGKKVRAEGNEVIFDDVALQRTQPCGMYTKKREYYDLGSLLYFMESGQGEQYTFLKTKELGYAYVQVTEKESIRSYLLGEVATHDSLVPDPPLARISRKRARGESKVMFHAVPQETENADPDGEGEDFSLELQALERPIGSRKSMMRLVGRDFHQESALKFVRQELAVSERESNEKSVRQKREPLRLVPTMRPSLLAELQRTGRDGESIRPYIIVPRNSAALINLLNVKEFLQEKQFKEAHGDIFSAQPVEVQVPINGTQMTFRVVDNTLDFKKRDWQLTVAAFVDGSQWQFKGWPFATIADLFATIKGFYVSYDQSMTPRYTHNAAGERYSAAAKPKVGVVDMDPYPVVKYLLKRTSASRHTDGLIAYQFWKEITRFLSEPRKPRFTSESRL